MGASRRLSGLAASVARRSAFPPGPLVIALSGGADSAACAWVAEEMGLPTRAIHVHHRLPASDALENAARSVAEHLSLSLEVSRLPRAPESEAGARDLRYEALEAGLSEDETLVTAHTRDDLAETVLAALLRGSGVDGLAGIPVRRGPVARPLLGVWRSETRELATLAGLPWMDDPANALPGSLRNRIRTELLPYLEGEFRPGLREVLAAGAETLRGDLEVLEALAGRVTVRSEGDRLRIARGELLSAGPVIGRRVVRQAMTRLLPPHPPDRRAVHRVWEVVSGDRTSTQLAGGITARRLGPWLELGPGASPDPSR